MSNGNAVAKVNYSHDAIIDLIIHTPWLTQNSLAAESGYTTGWLSQVMSSDAFKARLAERKKELVDPQIISNVEKNLEALALQSVGVLRDRLSAAPNPDIALKALDLSTRALGYGARNGSGPVQITQQFVVSVPRKAETGAEWERDFKPIEGTATVEANIQ